MNEPLALTVEPANPTVVAGTETHAFLKLSNDTPVIMNLRLVVDDVQAAWIVPTPAAIDVPPNGEATAALALRPPADAIPSPYLVTLHALDQANGSELARLSFALTVEAAPGIPALVLAVPAVAAVLPEGSALLLTLSLVAATSPNSADYMIQLGNPTETATTVDLNAADETNRLAFVIDPPQVILPANGQAQATLHVTANTPLSGSVSLLSHTITVQATRGESGQSAQASATFVQTQAEGLVEKLPLILAALGIGLVVLALLILFRDRGNEGATPIPIVIPLPVTAVPTQAPIVITAVPLPTNPAQPTVIQPPTLPANPTVPVVQPTPIVVTPIPVQPTVIVVSPVPVPPTTAAGTPADEPFAVAGAVVTVQPQTSSECPTAFLFTAQVTATGVGTVQYQWEFSNGQNPPPAVMEFQSAGTSVAQTSLLLTQSQEGWGRVQFTNPIFEPSNQALFVLNCEPTPSSELPATTTP